MNAVFKAKKRANFEKSPKCNPCTIYIYQYTYRAARAFVAPTAAIF